MVEPDVLTNNRDLADQLRRVQKGLVLKSRGWSSIFASFADAETKALARFEAVPVGKPTKYYQNVDLRNPQNRPIVTEKTTSYEKTQAYEEAFMHINVFAFPAPQLKNFL